MLISDTFRASFRAIGVNKNRSFLTMLGIIIGVASVVLMVSIGKTFEAYIVGLVESFGSNTMDIAPKGFEKFGGNLESMTYDDYEAIRKLSTVERVVPVIMIAKSVKYGREEISPMVLGGKKDIFGNYGLKLDRGRLLDESDDEGAKSFAVIGAQSALDLFGNTDPIGKKISIGDGSFQIVGVLQTLGSFLTQDLDKIVFIPFSTARALSGQRHLTYITLKTVGDPELAQQDITALLRQRHKIVNPDNDPDKDDFIARTSEQVTQTIGTVTLGLTVFLALVAGISLLVGGIGIMNIMLVSVTERTREIGLRKAVGARSRDILLQFLFEAVSLTVTGGIIGMVLGAGFGWFLTRLAARFLGDLTFILSPSAILMAFAMAIGTGLVFGIFPAKHAASLSPMEALRFE
ncbi:MAG: ABC transporter permease [Candidatus Peribacteraceae bacterium]|nr:ABC transporter permease [Candidatus Peribacteraceae bacterium]